MTTTQRGGLVASLSAVVGLVVLSSGTASASGYLTARFGSDHGTPASPNPYAVYYNPAALGGMKGTQITADLSFALRTVTYERTATSPSSGGQPNNPSYIGSNTGKGVLFNVLPLPFLGAASDLGTKNLRVGYAFYVPFGGMATWNKRDLWEGNAYAPGAVDGPQRWHNISGTILAIYNTAAVAYRFEAANLTVGVNVSGIYHVAQTVRARNVDGSDDVRSANGSLKEGRSYLDVHGFNLSAALGVYWEPTDKAKVGLSYTSQPGFGETRMSGTLEQQFGNIAARADKTDVDLLQTYPDIIRLGFAYRTTPKTEVRLDGEFVRWSVFDKQCVVQKGQACELDAAGNQTNGQVVLNIPREWRNAYGVRVGGAYWLQDNLELFGSVSMTTSAVPKTTIDPSTIDSLRFYGALGARYEVSSRLAIAGSYNPIYFVPVDTKGESKHDNYGSTSKSPSADGKYSSFIHLINLNATLAF